MEPDEIRPVEKSAEPLARQESLGHASIETAHDPFVSMDAAGRIVAWNKRAEETFGWTRAEVIGKTLSTTIIPERYRRKHDEGLKHFLATGEGPLLGKTNEVHAVCRDGHEFPVELAISVLETNGSVRFNAFLRDITERKRGEQYSEARHAIARALSVAATADEAIPRVLETLAQGFGWEVAECWQMDSTGGRLRCRHSWRAATVNGTKLDPLTRRLALGRGAGIQGRVWQARRSIWFDDIDKDLSIPRASAFGKLGLKTAIGLPVSSDCVIVGLTAQRACDEKLAETLDAIGDNVREFLEMKRVDAEAERLRNRFIAMTSHELRSPLTSIVGYAELAAEQANGGKGSEQRRALDVILRNAKRLQRLVDGLMFTAQVDTGEFSLDLGPSNLTEIAEECVEAARPAAEQQQVTLCSKIASVPDCKADRGRLGQLIDNLVSNAIKFTPADGKVEVTLNSRDGRAVLQVSDTGIGISAADQAGLFQPFSRATTAIEREIPGVGLGLMIAQAIAEAHGGKISVESEEGHGATFTVDLPLQAAAGKPVEIAAAELHGESEVA